MRAVIQVVEEAAVLVDDEVKGRIAQGLLVFLGITREDTPEDAAWLAKRVCSLRVLEFEELPQSLAESDAGLLVVSQFTLHASTRKGSKPSFHRAAPAEEAKPLYEEFLSQTASYTGKPAETGVFGALMKVRLTNHGPFTLILDSKLRE